MHHERGTLVRSRDQGKDAMGRDTACWLSGFGPDIDSPKMCPADLMPLWFAIFLPIFDDNTSLHKWPTLTARFVCLAQRWHVLDAAAWGRVRTQKIIASLELAKKYKVHTASPVLELFKRRLIEDEPTALEWYEANHDADYDVLFVSDAAYDFACFLRDRAGVVLQVAYTESWDRICSACFDALENECAKAEAALLSIKE
jgi:hypothetical protein